MLVKTHNIGEGRSDDLQTQKIKAMPQRNKESSKCWLPGLGIECCLAGSLGSCTKIKCLQCTRGSNYKTYSLFLGY